MSRIGLAVLLAVSLALAPLEVEGQQAPKGPRASIPRVGVLSPFTPAAAADDIGAFRQGIRDLGYIDGQTIAIETRWAEGRLDRLQLLAAELVRLKMDVIVTHSEPAIRAVKEATRTIPVVVAIAGDLVTAGHAVSLARPGGQITGLVDMAQDVGAKRVELLKELVPTLSRVGVLWNVASSVKAREFKEVAAGARALSLAIQSLKFGTPMISKGSSNSRRQRASAQSWFCQTPSLQVIQRASLALRRKRTCRQCSASEMAWRLAG